MVPMLDLSGQYGAIKDEIDAAVNGVLSSGHFILGENVLAFEKELAAYHSIRYAVSLASGTDALHLSLRGLGIKEGDEVITTPFTFFATVEAILYLRAIPVFVDIEPDTLNIAVEKIEERITEKTKAILPVHIFGQPVRMDRVMDIAKRYGIVVVEDCAQAFGAEYMGKKVGTFGNAGCFSFYPSKNLGCYGDGGMAITGEEGLYKRLMLLRNHGTVGPYQHAFVGCNSRLDEIQAAILRVKLKRIDAYNRLRQKKADIYASLLKDAVQCPPSVEGTIHVYHQYTIRSKKRDEIQKALKERAIASVVYYPIPLHLQEALSHLGCRKGDFIEAERASMEVLSLPIYPELEDSKIELIAEIVRETVK